MIGLRCPSSWWLEATKDSDLEDCYVFWNHRLHRMKGTRGMSGKLVTGDTSTTLYISGHARSA